MPKDVKLPPDAKLSEVDVKRVLERAVQIDGTQSVVTFSDLTQAAREAGISEKAVVQAVQELLLYRETASPADQATSASGEASGKSRSWIRTAMFCCLVVIALMVILVSVRIAP